MSDPSSAPGAGGSDSPVGGDVTGGEATEPPDAAERDHSQTKKRGIELATAGLLMALALVWAQLELGIVRTSSGADLLWALGLTLAVQGGLWMIPHLGWDDRLTWDEHYVLLPVAAAALLLGYYTWLAPETDHFFLLGWFVALVFMAGLVGLREVVSLAFLMIAASLGGLTLGTGAAPSTLDLVQAVVFMMVNIYAGVVFEHLQDEREERKELRERLAAEARTDHLTGLLNRRAFDQELRAELSRLDRYGGQGAVALLDLDFFKVYNDAYGHPAGDDALQEVARVLERESRTSDRVARYGGEEFGVVMPRITAAEAVEAAERLRAVLERHEFHGEEVLPSGRLTASLGVATYPTDGSTFEEVLRIVDRRLYRAKEEGRNRVCAASG